MDGSGDLAGDATRPESATRIKVARPPPEAVFDITLEGPLSTRATSQMYRAIRGDDSEVMVTTLAPDASGEEERRFLAGANAMLTLGARPDILTVYEVSADARCFVSELWTIGSCADLPALHLPLARKLDLVRRVCAAMTALHEAGAVHGCLCPGNVLLDDDLNPVLSEVGVVDVAKSMFTADEYGYDAFASPEALAGQPLGVASDVFSIGRFIEYVLLDEVPAIECAALPQLNALAAKAPAGLVRIVRRCTARLPGRRYSSVAELDRDLGRYGQHETVGIALEDSNEQNLTGLMSSLRPAFTRRPGDASASGWSRQRIYLAVIIVVVCVAILAALALGG